jgi:hypothetical protein
MKNKQNNATTTTKSKVFLYLKGDRWHWLQFRNYNNFLLGGIR